jgi:hypothetical protein
VHCLQQHNSWGYKTDPYNLNLLSVAADLATLFNLTNSSCSFLTISSTVIGIGVALLPRRISTIDIFAPSGYALVDEYLA